MESQAYNRILHQKHLESPAFNINWLASSTTSLLTAVRSWEYFESNKKYVKIYSLLSLMKIIISKANQEKREKEKEPTLGNKKGKLLKIL